jgi:hypothetical protein
LEDSEVFGGKHILFKIPQAATAKADESNAKLAFLLCNLQQR